MSSSSSFEWRWEALPSHLSFAQSARLLEVTPPSIWQRVQRKTLPCVDVLGSRMIPTLALIEERPVAAVALPPGEVMALGQQAMEAILSGEGDKPMFSPHQLAGVYLGLFRLPWPPPAEVTP